MTCKCSGTEPTRGNPHLVVVLEDQAMAEAVSRKLYTKQRTIFWTLFLGYAVYAYNRKSVSLALPALMRDLHLSKSDAGLIVSSQNMAYAVSKFAGGVLSDRISSRALFTAGLVLSGIATLLFTSYETAGPFAVLWFCNGLAQGAGWPACAKLLKHWFPAAELGTWWSLLSASANISGALAPFGAAWVIQNYSWQASLLVAGSVTMGIALIAAVTILDSPEAIGCKSFGSKQKDSSGPKAGKSGSETVIDLIRSPFLWLIAVCYLTVSAAKTSVVDWAQLYLLEDCKLPQLTASGFSASVETGGFLGGIIAGWLTDIFIRQAQKSGSSTRKGNPRLPAALIFTVLATVGFHLMVFTLNASSYGLWINAVGALLGASLYGPIAIYGVVATESAPDHLSGTAHAIVALAANLGAIISGLPFSQLARHYSWTGIFVILEATSLFTIFVILIGRNLSSSMSRNSSSSSTTVRVTRSKSKVK